VLVGLGLVGPFGDRLSALSGRDWLSVLSGRDWLSALSGRDARESRAIGEIFGDPGCLDRNGSRLRGARKGLGWSVYVPAFPLPREGQTEAGSALPLPVIFLRAVVSRDRAQ
jgi:hypothetical protein